MQFHRIEPYLHAMRLRVFGNRTSAGNKASWVWGASLHQRLRSHDTIPLLAVVDLAEVQHLALHHSAASTALALDNIPRAMFFAVFEASVELQEHAN